MPLNDRMSIEEIEARVRGLDRDTYELKRHVLTLTAGLRDATDAYSKPPRVDGSQPRYCPTCGQLMAANRDTAATPTPIDSMPRMAGDSSSIERPGPTSS